MLMAGWVGMELVLFDGVGAIRGAICALPGTQSCRHLPAVIRIVM